MTSATDVGAELDGVRERAVDDFTRRYQGRLPREDVEQCVLECYRNLHETARIKQHLPALTYNIARRELARLAENGATAAPH